LVNEDTDTVARTMGVVSLEEGTNDLDLEQGKDLGFSKGRHHDF